MPMGKKGKKYAMNPAYADSYEEAEEAAAKKSKKQLALKAQVPEGAKKVKIKAKVEMAGKGA